MIPTADSFITSYLLLTEGSDYILDSPKGRLLAFRRLTASLTSTDEASLVSFLLSSLDHLEGSVTLSRPFFSSLDAMISFFGGLIHYLPSLLLNQLTEVEFEKRRLRVVQLLSRVIRIITTSNYAFRYFFIAKHCSIPRSAASPRFFLVLEKLIDIWNDISPLIRCAFIDFALNLLEVTVEPDWDVRTLTTQRLATLLQSDRNAKVRGHGLEGLFRVLSQERPVNDPLPTGQLLNGRLLRSLTRCCLDDERRVRLLAYEVTTKLYVLLMERYPRATFDLERLYVGQLAGALTVAYKKIVKRKGREAEEEMRVLKHCLWAVSDYLRYLQTVATGVAHSVADSDSTISNLID